MNVEKGNFIEIDFIAKIKDENKIFDLTNEEVAKKEKIYNKNFSYKPLIICLGENHLLKGLDKALIGKEVGNEYTIDVSPEDGYGKKHAQLIQLVSTNVFTRQNIKPFPGLQVQIDNMFGLIKTVSGGRTLVDFNHPLAGKTLEYKVKILRVIQDDNEKIKSLLNLMLKKEIDFKFESDNLTINEKIPKEAHEFIEKEIKRLITSVKKVNFS
nr:peptidylprolyl isomerase [Candidatus Woesearchaeota archaeon]